MSMKGERFELNLDPEEAYERSLKKGASGQTSSQKSPLGLDFVKDVFEHEPTTTSAPQPPTLKKNTSGFPAHKKRTSRFKQERVGDGQVKSSVADDGPGTYLSKVSHASASERKDIDRETTQMIQSMSPGEIQEAQKELLADPSFAAIQRLLLRSSIDSDDTMQPEARPQAELARSEVAKEGSQQGTVKMSSGSGSKAGKKVSFASETSISSTKSPKGSSGNGSSPAVPVFAPKDIKPVSTSSSTYRTPFYRAKYSTQGSSHDDDDSSTAQLAPGGLQPSQAASEKTQVPARPPSATSPNTFTAARPSDALPALDPNSATFLKDLHETYFPNLPSDPRSLAWMAPVESESEASNAPASSQTEDGQDLSSSVPPPNLRFGFRGNIINPALSAKIPVTKGLHHHGRDPGSAGYTIAELAIYAHSTVAGQRCFAYQLLGRILYRLGTGNYKIGGPRVTDRSQERNEETHWHRREEELWQEMRKGHILEQILAEAGREPGTGSESARVWALEAVWLWRKGGGREVHTEAGEEDEEDDVMGDAAGQILEEGLNPPF